MFLMGPQSHQIACILYDAGGWEDSGGLRSELLTRNPFTAPRPDADIVDSEVISLKKCLS